MGPTENGAKPGERNFDLGGTRIFLSTNVPPSEAHSAFLILPILAALV